MPADAEKATVVAVLNYRSMPDDLAEKAGVENPVTEMASARTPVFASEEIKKGKPAAEETATPAPAAPTGSEVPWWLIVLGAFVVSVAAFYAVRRFRTKA
jgi:type VI protein secretion system component VasF